METNLPELEEVHVADGMMEAEIVRGKLESKGIRAHLDYESAGRLFGIQVDGLARVRVLVNRVQAEAAREALLTETEDEPQSN